MSYSQTLNCLRDSEYISETMKDSVEHTGSSDIHADIHADMTRIIDE